MSTFRNNPISITSKEVGGKIIVMNLTENLDLVDEASKSSEYTQNIPESSRHRASIAGIGVRQLYPVTTNSSLSRQSGLSRHRQHAGTSIHIVD